MSIKKKKSLSVLIPQNLCNFSIKYIFYLFVPQNFNMPTIEFSPTFEWAFFPQEVNSCHLSDLLFLHFILSYPEVPRPGHLTIYSKAPETSRKEKGCRESGRHMQTGFQRQGLPCSSCRLPLYLISCPPPAPKQRAPTGRGGRTLCFILKIPKGQSPRPRTSVSHG